MNNWVGLLVRSKDLDRVEEKVRSFWEKRGGHVVATKWTSIDSDASPPTRLGYVIGPVRDGWVPVVDSTGYSADEGLARYLAKTLKSTVRFDGRWDEGPALQRDFGPALSADEETPGFLEYASYEEKRPRVAVYFVVFEGIRDYRGVEQPVPDDESEEISKAKRRGSTGVIAAAKAGQVGECLELLAAVKSPALRREVVDAVLAPEMLGILESSNAGLVAVVAGKFPESVPPERVARVIHAACLVENEEVVRQFSPRLPKNPRELGLLPMLERTWRSNGLVGPADLLASALETVRSAGPQR